MSDDPLVMEGRFRLLRHLGGGAMSEVYLAEQLSLGRKVAIKVLKRDLGASAEMAERFRREALLLSTVNHPNVVRVIDFASTPHGTMLVLELAEGDTLEAMLRFGPLEPRRASAVLLQLAEGLAAIHARGIVHRDIKPQNIVLGATPQGDTARLLDFGIARLLELPDLPADGAPRPEVPFLSGGGLIPGTPAYVSPEQATGQVVDARSDVYSFGVMAFRMLSGKLPFPGPTVDAFLEQHIGTPAPALAQVEPRLMAFPGLTRLVRQCLEKRPEARPADGQALVELLKPLAAQEVPQSTQVRRAVQALTNQTWQQVSLGAAAVRDSGVHTARAAVDLAREVDEEYRRSALFTVVVALALAALYVARPLSPEDAAARALEQGQAEQALALVDAALDGGSQDVPRLLGLKVATLDRLGRRKDANALLAQAPFQATHGAPELVAPLLARNLGASETDTTARELLALAPRQALEDSLTRLSQQPLSVEGWGALRWLDVGTEVPLEQLTRAYEKALASPACHVRRVAAKRLGDAGNPTVIPALRELSESPKDSPGGADCGQDAAAEAIRRLKPRTAGRGP